MDNQDYDTIALPRLNTSSTYSSADSNTYDYSLQPTLDQPLIDLLFPEGMDNIHEKHQLETEDDHESKRQERNTETEKKKPGRKPILNEPTTKRKAQNRAAQRAFRERKEGHVKELEARVAALEAQNNTQSAENAYLKAQLASVRAGSQDFPFPDDTNFTFSIPPPLSVSRHGSSSSPSTLSKDSPASMRNALDCPSLSTGNSPQSASESDFNAAAMPFFNRSASTGSQAFGQFTPNDFKPKTTELQENAIFFDNMLSPTRDISFDGFNPMDYREQANFDLDPLFDGVGAFDFEPELQVKEEPVVKVEKISEKISPIPSEVGCKEVWRKIVEHPQFETFDMDELCQKMKDQAKCTESPLHEKNWGQAKEWTRFDNMLDEYASQQKLRQML